MAVFDAITNDQTRNNFLDRYKICLVWILPFAILKIEFLGLITTFLGNDLEFKIVNKEEVARLWGQIKNRDRMNFDKFSRALRYYYDKRILIHNPSSRLTYCFMRNPSDPVSGRLNGKHTVLRQNFR